MDGPCDAEIPYLIQNEKLNESEEKIKKQIYKPGSVSTEVDAYHLSSPTLTCRINRPTLRDQASNPQAPVYMVFQSVRFTLPPPLLRKR